MFRVFRAFRGFKRQAKPVEWNQTFDASTGAYTSMGTAVNSLRWQVASANHIGGRKEQQDCLGYFTTADVQGVFAVVADGMGGHRGSAVASRAVIETAESLWHACQGHPEEPETFLETLCQEAHDLIHQRAEQQQLEPHTTLVALLLQDGRASWAHVGDSRLYHFRAHDYVMRTRDHSLVQMLVEIGDVSEEEMAQHPDQNRLLRSIGGRDRPKATHGHVVLEANDQFLLCSDGFWETTALDEIQAILQAPDLAEAIEQGVLRAAGRGGIRGDNVSAVGLRVDPVSMQTSQPEQTAARSAAMRWRLFS